MSSKSKRGGKPRGIPGWRPGEFQSMSATEVAAVLLDGIQCPYCARRVLERGGMYACECGWSGAFVSSWLCDDPSCLGEH